MSAETATIGSWTAAPRAALDFALTAQLAVAWAGETGEEPRLGWWRTELDYEFGGHDLFRRLLPHTWRWASLQAVREAARRRDAELRARANDPDRLVSLYRLGFAADERLEERLLEHKRSGRGPLVALPTLGALLQAEWERERFAAWIREQAAAGEEPTVQTTPAGRRLRGTPPSALDACVRALLLSLSPLGDEYPLPHYRTPA